MKLKERAEIASNYVYGTGSALYGLVSLLIIAGGVGVGLAAADMLPADFIADYKGLQEAADNPGIGFAVAAGISAIGLHLAIASVVGVMHANHELDNLKDTK